MADVYRTVISKRDRREYDSARPLPEDVIHRILQAGRMAGTSSNKQQLRFVAIRSAATREEMAKAGPGGAPIARAPFVVAIAVEKGPWLFDVGRAAQNMMVAAWAEGVLSCPIGIRDEDIVRNALGYPEEYEVVNCVAFGYPVADLPARESRPRLPMDEVVHNERW
jgi:nitroreductase